MTGHVGLFYTHIRGVSYGYFILPIWSKINYDSFFVPLFLAFPLASHLWGRKILFYNSQSVKLFTLIFSYHLQSIILTQLNSFTFQTPQIPKQCKTTQTRPNFPLISPLSRSLMNLFVFICLAVMLFFASFASAGPVKCIELEQGECADEPTCQWSRRSYSCIPRLTKNLKFSKIWE